MARSFESLTSAEVLTLAIDVERINAGTYRKLARIFKKRDRNLNVLFTELYEEELDHMDQLEALWSMRFGERRKARIVARDIDALAETVGPNSLDFTTLRELDTRKAMALTKAAEQGAVDFYSRAAQVARDAKMKSLFTVLAEAEQEHLKQVALDDEGTLAASPKGPT